MKKKMLGGNKSENQAFGKKKVQNTQIQKKEENKDDDSDEFLDEP